MSFLLDTNICSAAMRNEAKVFSRMTQHGGNLYISRIVLAESYAGAFGARDPGLALNAIERIYNDVDVLEFDDECARQFGRLKAVLKPQGITVPPMDLLIASTALVHGLTLVTHNTRDFIKVPGLTVVDWLAP